MIKKKILLFADWYEPGFKAGGPIRSCVNFAQHMQQDYQVFVFTSDRDLGSEGPYENITRDEWIGTEGSLQIFYCSPGHLSMKNIRRQVDRIRPDFIYLNSMFSRYFTIYPLLLNARGRPQIKLILSPRGMLRTSAIRFKSPKKKIFLKAFRWLGLHHKVHFHATDETEQKDIQRYFGPASKISLIANFPGIRPDGQDSIEKRRGELNIIFVGRIHPIKNLDFLLEILRTSLSTIKLTIVGNLEDKIFWQKCQDIIRELPSNITVHYLGEMANHHLPATIGEHHIFALPTKGENFGHAIFEALSLKRPVLISDQTPWRHLQQAKAGWDISLQDPAGFQAAVRQAADWDQSQYNEWSAKAFDFVSDYMDNSNALEKYRQLFS
jgi:glycosyltransferase involved in cell wall biosynthesis